MTLVKAGKTRGKHEMGQDGQILYISGPKNFQHWDIWEIAIIAVSRRHQLAAGYYQHALECHTQAGKRHKHHVTQTSRQTTIYLF